MPCLNLLQQRMKTQFMLLKTALLDFIASAVSAGTRALVPWQSANTALSARRHRPACRVLLDRTVPAELEMLWQGLMCAQRIQTPGV